MYTMTDILDRENAAILDYCEDMANEWRTNYSPNAKAQSQRFALWSNRERARYVDKSGDRDMYVRAWACRIGA